MLLAANLTLGTTNTALSALLSAFVFSDCEITWNGQVVRPQTGLTTPWGVACDYALNEDRAFFDNHRYSQFTLMDSFNCTSGLSGNAQGRTAIIAGTAATSSTRPFSIIIPLRALGIRTGDAIPPGVEIRIRVTRNANTALTWGADSATTNSILTMSSCNLYTRQIRLTQEAASALSLSWQKEAARLSFQRVKMFSQAFPIGNSTPSINQALPGPRPSRVVVAYIRQSVIQNTQADNKMELRPEVNQCFTNAYLEIGDGRFYPVQAITMATSAATASTAQFGELYEMYKSCCSVKDCGLSDGDLSNVQLLCFNTSRSGDVTNVVDIQEECNINFRATMSAAPTLAYSLMIFSWTDSVIEIDSSGSVTVDS